VAISYKALVIMALLIPAIALFFFSIYFATQSPLKKVLDIKRESMLTNVPSLLHAWYSSAAWALGCIGGCALLWWWADENNAFESGSDGQTQLVVLLLAVSLATVVFHVQACKRFQRAYFIREDGWPPPSSLAFAWLFVLGIVRASWIVAVLFLVLCILLSGGTPDAGWR
jgi:hypothetical protein